MLLGIWPEFWAKLNCCAGFLWCQQDCYLILSCIAFLMGYCILVFIFSQSQIGNWSNFCLLHYQGNTILSNKKCSLQSPSKHIIVLQISQSRNTIKLKHCQTFKCLMNRRVFSLHNSAVQTENLKETHMHMGTTYRETPHRQPCDCASCHPI